MTPEQAPDFMLRLTALSELFNAKLSEAAQVLYFDALKDLDLNALIDAIQSAAKRCRFMPKPVELRDLAVGDIADEGMLAWTAWQECAKRAGSMRWVICDSVLARTIEATFGSWPQSCELELSPEMWASKRKEFLSNYRIYAARTTQRKELLLRGNGAIDDRWNRIVCIDGGEYWTIPIAQAAERLKGGPYDGIFVRLLSA